MKLMRTEDAVGQVLCHDITQIIKGVTKDAVFRKGHIIQPEDVPVLLSVGKESVYIWENDDSMYHENEAAEILRDICISGNMHATEAPAEATPESTPVEKTEIIVFAAASMTETLTQIKGLYEVDHPEITITYNFDSSGTLKTQIQEGAECDLFISAGQKQMNQLDINASPDVNTDGLDFVLDGSRLNLLENKVVLAVPDGNPKGLASFDLLTEPAMSVFESVGFSPVA